MLTKRIILLTTVVVLVGISIFVFSWFKSLPDPTLRLEAERSVYAVLLAKQPPYFAEYTLSGHDCTSKCVQYLLDVFPKLKRQTIIDYQANDRQPYALKDYLPSTINNEFVNPNKNKQYGQQISFSRIAFDPFLTQALVLVEDCRGDGCFDSSINSMYSIGTYIFLQKWNDEWIIQQEEPSYLIERPSP